MKFYSLLLIILSIFRFVGVFGYCFFSVFSFFQFFTEKPFNQIKGK